MAVVIDVREPDEFSAGHVMGAKNIPLEQLVHTTVSNLEFPLNSEIIVYCRSGARAGVAERSLREKGFTQVTNGIDQQTTERLLDR